MHGTDHQHDARWRKTQKQEETELRRNQTRVQKAKNQYEVNRNMMRRRSTRSQNWCKDSKNRKRQESVESRNAEDAVIRHFEETEGIFLFR